MNYNHINQTNKKSNIFKHSNKHSVTFIIINIIISEQVSQQQHATHTTSRNFSLYG